MIRSFVRTSLALSLLLLAFRGHALADEDGSTRERAAQAYDRGAAAYRAEDYAAAAEWFERANRLAPSPVAIAQAIRAHRNAHNIMRAGTLALRIEDEDGLSTRVTNTVRDAIEAARPRYLRVEVTCSSPCQLTVDGAPVDSPRFFIEPDQPLDIVATFATGTRSERVSGHAGQLQTVSFEAPEGSTSPQAAAEAAGPEEVLSLEEGENPYQISRLRFFSRPRAVFFTALAATATMGGILTWSALDTRSATHDYNAAVAASDPDATRLKWVHDRDVHRTRGYMVFTGLMVVLTGAVASLTDWTPHGSRTTTADVNASRTGGSLTITHRF